MKNGLCRGGAVIIFKLSAINTLDRTNNLFGKIAGTKVFACRGFGSNQKQ